MAGFSKADALVLRETRYREADRILTLYTSEYGRITAKARGALRKNSRTGAATQQLTFSEMMLFGNRGRLTVNEATVREPFSGLRTDLSSFALGCYFAECVEMLTEEETPEPLIMQLILNSLYALSNALHSAEYIKAVFEMRLMSLTGYAPNLKECAVCGREEPESPCLMIETGRICCRECRKPGTGNIDALCRNSLRALRCAVEAPPKSIFRAEPEGDALLRTARASEDYFLCHTERRFQTLDYWKKIR